MNFYKHFITHSLIFLQFYWIHYITWWKITRELLLHNLWLDWYLSSDYFRRSKASGKNQLKWFTFSSLCSMWKRNKLVLWILVIEMYKKMISNAALERKKRQQNLLSLHNTKIKGRVQSIKTLFWPAGCQLIMSSLERLSLKFHILPWKFCISSKHSILEQYLSGCCCQWTYLLLKGFMTAYDWTRILK